jgi:hypothetical protein
MESTMPSPKPLCELLALLPVVLEPAELVPPLLPALPVLPEACPVPVDTPSPYDSWPLESPPLAPALPEDPLSLPESCVLEMPPWWAALPVDWSAPDAATPETCASPLPVLALLPVEWLPVWAVGVPPEDVTTLPPTVPDCAPDWLLPVSRPVLLVVVEPLEVGGTLLTAPCVAGAWYCVWMVSGVCVVGVPPLTGVT